MTGAAPTTTTQVSDVTDKTIADAAGRLRYDHIDAMRAFSVLVVVLSHAGVVGLAGDSGVTIFFTISGFIITWLILRERDRSGGFSPSRFWLRRVLKLGPPLVVVVLIPTGLYALFRPVSPLGVLGQTLFFYNWLQIFTTRGWSVLPGSHPVWSLSVEEQFYIIFAVMWLLTLRTSRQDFKVACVAVAAVIVAAVIRLAIIHDGGHVLLHIERGTDGRMDALAVGVLSALAYHRYRNGHLRWIRHFGRDWVLLAAVAVYAISEVSRATAYRNTWMYSIQPVAAVGMIFYGLLADQTRLSRAFHRLCGWKLVATIGLASYSIYLVNGEVIAALSGVSRHLHHHVGTVLDILASVGAGVLCYYLVEVPALRFKVRHNF